MNTLLDGSWKCKNYEMFINSSGKWECPEKKIYNYFTDMW